MQGFLAGVETFTASLEELVTASGLILPQWLADSVGGSNIDIVAACYVIQTCPTQKRLIITVTVLAVNVWKTPSDAHRSLGNNTPAIDALIAGHELLCSVHQRVFNLHAVEYHKAYLQGPGKPKPGSEASTYDIFSKDTYDRQGVDIKSIRPHVKRTCNSRRIA